MYRRRIRRQKELFMIERIRELAAEMKPAMIDLAQRLIRTPSLSGQEKDVALLTE